MAWEIKLKSGLCLFQMVNIVGTFWFPTEEKSNTNNHKMLDFLVETLTMVS